MNAIKRITILIMLLGVGYISLCTYHYFCDTHEPTITITGLEPGNWYKGTINGHIIGTDAYKLVQCTMHLDNQPFIASTNLKKTTYDDSFSINTNELADGKHTLSITLSNGIYQQKSAKKTIDFYVDNKPLHATFLHEAGETKIYQGKTLHIPLRINKPIKHAYIETLNKQYPCIPEAKQQNIYECFIPIACEETPQEHVAHLHVTDVVGNTITLDTAYEIVPYPFKRQPLSINNEKVKKEKELGLSNEMLEQKLIELTEQSPQHKLWHGPFFPPTEIQRISTEFGAIRITKEKGRYLHQAVDIVNFPKSVIWAPHNGVVVLKDRFALSGNTVVIDHGCGILSLFFHLDDFAEKLEVGSAIKQGNPIGLLGSTGYASAPHLHWEMRIANVAVDPLQWTKQNS